MKFFKLPTLLITLIVLSLTSILLTPTPPNSSYTPAPVLNVQPSILGQSTSVPTIFISSSKQNYHNGGFLSQSTLDEPTIELYSFEDSGQVIIDIYNTDINFVLEYLKHDEKNQQISNIDYSGLTKINSITTTISKSQNRLLLPIGEEGTWLLHIKFGSTENFAILNRTSIAAIAKEADNQIIVWVQDLVSKKTINNYELSVYSLENSVSPILKTKPNADGISKLDFKSKTLDVAVIKTNEHTTVLPINLRYLNGNGQYEMFQPKIKTSRLFIFTDRPLYRPEDTVFFKAVIREDDDARYKIPTGVATVKVYKNWDKNNVFFEQSYPISESGTINGQFVIPASQGTGIFQISLEIPNYFLGYYGWDNETWNQDSTSFQVEYYRKPEYFLDISTEDQTLISGDTLAAKITGSYFSGQPLSNKQISYTVTANNFYEYEFLSENPQFFDANNFNYGYWNGNQLTEISTYLDGTGNVDVQIQTGAENFKSNTPKVFSIEAKFLDESGNPVSARKNFLVYPGEFSIFRHSNFFTGQINKPFNFPVLIKSHTTSSIKDVKLIAKITRESWIPQPVSPDKKYPNYVKETQQLPDLNSTTDQLGKAQFTFIPTQTGSYKFDISGQDKRGNTIAKTMYIWVSDINRPAPSNEYYQELKIETDKQHYEPGEKVNLKIWSDTPDHDFLLTLERGRVNRYQVIKLNGQHNTIPLSLTSTDVPNIYVTISGFNDNFLISDSLNISVSPESKRLKVDITPESSRYGPGQIAIINIETKDSNGKPVPAELAFWAIDKAIFELSDNNLGDIFKRFWSQRYNQTATSHSLENIIVNNAEMGGCFLPGTQVLMSDGKTKSIEDILPGEHILTKEYFGSFDLVKAKVTNTHKEIADGYLIINSKLRLTPSHILSVNGDWKTAGEIQIGDFITNIKGLPITVDSIEWQLGKVEVFNLQIESYHSFFADGFWVHNDKGDGSGRSIFKDTAYWNPSIKTDKSGKAKISFKLPDNLTTWTMAAIATTTDTKVGQTTSEIIASKDIIIRPILPNILRVGDKAVISALVYNHTDVPQTFEAQISFDSGKILSGQNQNAILINPHSFQQLYWKISVEEANPESQLDISVNSKLGKSDSIMVKIPVLEFGFMDTETHVGSGNQTYTLNIPENIESDKTSITISLSSNLLGTIPEAMKWLIEYPYGCVEQTTSRLVPAIVAKNNLDIYYDAVNINQLDRIISTGIDQLTKLRSSDGGWGWWSENHSQAYITSYVIEYLIQGKNTGVEIPESLISSAAEMLKNFNTSDPEENIYKLYGLSLVGYPDIPKINNFQNIGPVTASFAVLINSKLDQDPNTNGVSELIKMAKNAGETIYWPADPKSPFPSIDASTALAIKAIVAGNGNREFAAKSIRYLLSTRKNAYWSNTHATALLVSAVTEFYKTGTESNPNLTYSIDVNGKNIFNGNISNSKQLLEPITVPKTALKLGENKIVISKSGSGEIYSSITGNYWRTDKNTSPTTNTISLNKSIINEKGSEYSIGVGDTVSINFSIDNLPPDSNYIVIEDHLPAGLIPINTHLKNESSSSNNYNYFTRKEFTQSGVIISSYKSISQLSYQARAITEGEFLSPPATVQLMYLPEISARTTSNTTLVEKNSQTSWVKQIENQISENNTHVMPYVFISIFAGALIIFALILVIKRKAKVKKSLPIKNLNPTDTPESSQNQIP